MRLSRLIRYPIDIISAGVVVCALSLQVVALARGWPWYTAFPIFLLLREVNLVEHNHMHLPMSSEVADHFRRLCLTVGSVSNIARHYWARLTASNMPWYKLNPPRLGAGDSEPQE